MFNVIVVLTIEIFFSGNRSVEEQASKQVPGGRGNKAKLLPRSLCIVSLHDVINIHALVTLSYYDPHLYPHPPQTASTDQSHPLPYVKQERNLR